MAATIEAAYTQGLASLFEQAGEAATWIPSAGGGPISCTVIRRRPDLVDEFGVSRTRRASVVLKVRVSEVAEPHAGDRVVIGAETFALLGEPVRDHARRLVWACGAALAP